MPARVGVRLAMRALLAALLAACFAGCGDGRTLVVVKLAGSSDGVAVFGVTTKLGPSTAAPQLFTGDVHDFGLALPAGATGSLEIDVVGLDAANCLIVGGVATAIANGQSELDVTVELTPYPRTCS